MRLFFTITDLLPISEKRLNYLTLFLLINVHCYGIAVYLLLILNFLQIKFLSSIRFTDNDIGRIINSLDLNKAHGNDMMSIRMLKICGDSTNKPLVLIFRACLEHGVFPQNRKKANVVPIYKKNDKQSLKNYRPVSLLLICWKIFERLLYNNMFSFLIENNLISQNQSKFKPGDPWINQVLSITHEIY